MNLNEVFNLPEKQWTPKDNQVQASILSVGQAKKDEWGFKQPIVLTDLTGASQELTVQTKFEDGLMQSDEVGQSKMWICKWYGGKGGKCLVGYTTTKRTATQQPQQGSQQAAQQPRQPAAQLDAAAANYAKESNDKATGMVRHGVVCAAIQAGQIVIRSHYSIDDLNYWVEYIMTGKAPLPPNKVPDDSQVPEEDIPF